MCNNFQNIVWSQNDSNMNLSSVEHYFSEHLQLKTAIQYAFKASKHKF